MQHHKKLTFSLIIPCYNEAALLPACFAAIQAQTVPPDEILVIDNNSTDKTAKIARKYPGVRVIRERQQGLIPSRNRGFNEAKGDILARIDADARIDPDWVERIKHHFEHEPIDGITGLGVTDMLPFFGWPRSAFWSWVYFTSTEAFFRVPIMWGTNMAITKKNVVKSAR